MNQKFKNIYLMASGTFLPAISGVIILNLARKNQNIDGTSIIVFAGLSIIGGYLTAKMIYKK